MGRRVGQQGVGAGSLCQGFLSACCSPVTAGIFLPCPSSINPAFIQASPSQEPSIVLRDNLWALACSSGYSQTQARLRATELNQELMTTSLHPG